MKTNYSLFLGFLLLISFRVWSQNIGCKPPAGSQGINIPYCPGMGNFYPPGNQEIIVPINFIFLQPLTGVGRWDTVTAASCIYNVNMFNFLSDNIIQPWKVIAVNPPSFISKTKIHFTFKSISKIPHYSYSNSPHWDFFNTDSTALNIIYGEHPTSYGYGVSNGLGSNEIFFVDLLNYTGRIAMNDSAVIKLAFHEIGHAFGLPHTNVKSFGSEYTAGLNPNGYLTPDPPLNDYWLEDTLQWDTALRGNNVMSYCWDCNRYLSPNQIYYMHQMLRTNPILKKMVSSYPNLNYSCVADHNNDLFVSGNQTLGGVFLTPPGDLTIQAGSNVTLSDCMIMTPGSKIIIEPGAKFTINHGSINTFNCTGQWKGIEVRSNAGATQAYSSANSNFPAGNVGMIELNYARISNAIRAVCIGELDASSNYIYGTGAGIIKSENSQYVNNTIGVQFNYYLNTNNNFASFKRDTFIVDPDFKGQMPLSAIRIDNNYGIDVLGCYFEEIDYATSTAIEVYNGTIFVKDFCSALSGGNCTGILTSNKFIGFKRAIDIFTSVKNSPSIIDHVFIDQHPLSNLNPSSKRDNMEGGIYIGNNFGTKIINSEIKSIKRTNSSLPMAYGIYLDNCDGYVIENNLIRGINSSSYRTEGICVNNSGIGSNSIYNNFFKDHELGLWAQNLNFNPTTGAGLLINCNDFKYNKFHVGVQSQPSTVAGIAETQGLALTSNEQDNVRNDYNSLFNVSSCASGGENKYYIDTQNGFAIVSHGSFLGSQFHPIPQNITNTCSNPSEVVDIIGNPPSSSVKTSYCPISYLPSFSNRVLSEKIAEFDNQIGTLNAAYVSKLDGGSTAYLLNLLLGNILESALHDSLVSKEFLSDTVLISYFSRVNTDYEKKTSVFIKNAPLHPNLWKKVSNIGLNTQEYYTWDSIQRQNKLSVRCGLQSQLTMANTNFGLHYNEKIRRFLDDSSDSGCDSIIAIYQLNKLPQSKIKLADTYIKLTKYTEAQDVINSLLNETQANGNICKLLQYSLNVRKDYQYIDTLLNDSAAFEFLVEIASLNIATEQGYAKALLKTIYNYRSEEVRLEPEDSNQGERMLTQNNSSHPESKNSKDLIFLKGIKVYPNPASTELTVEVESPKNVFSLEIIGVTGNLLLRLDCTQKCTLDLSVLENGIYLLNLYKEKTLVNTKKVVVIR